MDYPVLLQVLRECDPEDRLGCLTGTGNDAEDIRALTAYVETLAGKSRILYVLRHVVDDEGTSEQTHGMADAAWRCAPARIPMKSLQSLLMRQITVSVKPRF